MNDALRYFELDPVHRRWHHDLMSFSLVYAWHENFVLVLSHDEVVHGKRSLLSRMPGDAWQQRANLRLLLAWMWCHPGRKLLFMGGEWGQATEWSEAGQLDWAALADDGHAGILQLVARLNSLLSQEAALHELDFSPQGFQWVNVHDAAHSVFSFLRKGKRPDDDLLVVANATPVPRPAYRVGVPAAGWWRELLNTDGMEHSLSLTLPPLALLVLKRES
jgi:1,4-alpha-glucan branching enzyme